jgi:hypothetical protein
VYVPENFADDEGRIFDSRLSYKKGAAIIHMIRQEVGNDSLFFGIMSSFLTRYGNSNASGADFMEHVEENTAKDFNQFFDQWYYGQGYPVHSIRWYHQNDTLYINSLQTPSSSTPFFNLKLDFQVSGENLDTIVTFRQDENFNRWEIYLPGKIDLIKPDPNQWLLIDVSDISAMNESGNDSGFSIIPNPATDLIRISKSIDKPISKYSVFLTNSEGKIMIRRESNSQSEEINVSAYPAGMYFVIIKSGRSSFLKKLIIN